MSTDYGISQKFAAYNPQGQLRGRLGADPDLPMEFGKGIMQSFISRFR